MPTAPFDIYGDLEDAYNKAERNGDVEVMETLDAFRIWSERPRTTSNLSLHTLLLAIQGDGNAQDDVGYAFFRLEDDIDDNSEEYEWLDRPELAQYWYGLAAEDGWPTAQNGLGILYCPKLKPLNVFKLGRLARLWWEVAADNKHTDGMRNLARCLRCGKCFCCDRDVERADALENEACELDKQMEN